MHNFRHTVTSYQNFSLINTCLKNYRFRIPNIVKCNISGGDGPIFRTFMALGLETKLNGACAGEANRTNSY